MCRRWRRDQNHAIHPDISGDRNAGLIGKRKGRDIVTCVRHRGRRPVGSGVPIAADRIHAPSDAVGVQRTERKRYNHGAGQNWRFHGGNYAYGSL